MKKYNLLLLNLFICCVSQAASVLVGGIYYELNTLRHTASVTTSTVSNRYSGDIVIPNTITISGVGWPVIAINKQAFYNCTGLTSISLPESMETIGQIAFSGCIGLTAVKFPAKMKSIGDGAFSGCTALTSLLLPDSVGTLGISAFGGCTGLTSVVLPKFVQGIGAGTYSPFLGCTGMTDITIPDTYANVDFLDAFENLVRIHTNATNIYYTSNGNTLFSKSGKAVARVATGYVGEYTIPEGIDSIAKNAFSGCRKINKVNICHSVSCICEYAFRGCTVLSSLVIPSSVERICQGTFEGCTGLSSLMIPSSVTWIDQGAFSGCTLKPLVIFNTCNNYYSSQSDVKLSFRSLQGLSGELYIPYGSQISTATVDYKGAVKYFGATNIEIFARQMDFDVEYAELESIISLEKVCVGEDVLIPDASGRYRAMTKVGAHAEYHPLSLYFKHDGIVEHVQTRMQTKDVFATIDYESTQRTVTLKDFTLDISDDDHSLPIISKYFEHWSTGERLELGTKVDVPSHGYGYRFGLVGVCADGDTIRFRGYNYATTKDVSIAVEQNTSPTVIKLKGSFDAGDEQIMETYFMYNNEKYPGDNFVLTGLSPGGYTITYCVKAEYGQVDSKQLQLTTSIPQLTTLAPRVPNRGEAIVSATTNMADEETGAGFEWRKTDAPDVVPSKSATAAIYDGKLEGVVKGLDATAYWKVRPYYKSATGQMYYGEWVGFDPSDFSYFEPTVHTYGDAQVTESSATMTGYAMQGSDEVTEQGFEYWPESGAQARGASGSVRTVTATGQRMTATVGKLSQGTTYFYRAYVKTNKAKTYYGEQQQFTTSVVSAIELPAADKAGVDLTVVGAASHSLTVRVDGSGAVGSLSVYTQSGQLVGRYSVATDGSAVTISGLPGGLLLLSVRDQYGTVTRKAMVRR